jgi:hypothetical protein
VGVKERFVALVLNGAAFVAGMFIGVYTVGQMLLIAFFGIPTAIRWYRAGFLISLTPAFRYLAPFTFLLTLLFLIHWGLRSVAPAYVLPFWVGVGFATLHAFPRSSGNPAALSDFVRLNRRFLTEEAYKLLAKLGMSEDLK